MKLNYFNNDECLITEDFFYCNGIQHVTRKDVADLCANSILHFVFNVLQDKLKLPIFILESSTATALPFLLSRN